MDPPVPEAGWEENSILGAEKAAKYFLQLYAYVYQTGDLTEWDRLCHPESEACAQVGENATSLKAEGKYYVGGGMEVERVLGQTNTLEESSYIVEVIGWIDGAIGYHDGVEFDKRERQKYYFVVVPSMVDGQWRFRMHNTEKLNEDDPS